jgi:hypothetical protein
MFNYNWAINVVISTDITIKNILTVNMKVKWNILLMYSIFISYIDIYDITHYFLFINMFSTP